MAPRYEHLYEVNARWLAEVPPHGPLDTVRYADESARIRDRLLRVHAVLRKRRPAGLAAKQRTRRATALSQLFAYAMGGTVPGNAVSDGTWAWPTGRSSPPSRRRA